MKKQTIKLSESQLRNLIKKSINEAVCEDEYDLPWTDREPKNDMDRLRLSRYNGLVEIIEYYSAQEDDGKPLSKEQYEQLKNACDTLECFGEPGQKWAEFGREILSRNEQASMNESQLRKIIKEALNELDWKTYKNAANKRLAQGKYANANELSDMAKNRFDDEFNDNYRYDTFGAKLAGKHSKTFDSTFIPTEEPSLQGRNEKGEELFRNKGRYYNSRRGLTTPEKFFKDKEMSDTFNTATQELDNYNNGNYDYTPDKGWHLKESKLNKIIKKSIKKVLKESSDYANMSDFEKMNFDLSKYGDAKVIPSQSDDKHVTLAISKNIDAYQKVQIGKYMRTRWNCHVYDTAENGNYIIFTLIRKPWNNQAEQDAAFDEYNYGDSYRSY